MWSCVYQQARLTRVLGDGRGNGDERKLGAAPTTPASCSLRESPWNSTFAFCFLFVCNLYFNKNVCEKKSIIK